MSFRENKNSVSEETLSTCASSYGTEHSESTSNKSGSFPNYLPSSDVLSPVLPAYGHNQNFPSASAAIKIRGMPPKLFDSEAIPNNNADDLQPSEEVPKQGRHVVS